MFAEFSGARIAPYCPHTPLRLPFMGVSTGLFLIDYLLRPILRFSFKFYLVGFILLFLVYGFIAYQAMKSAYLSEQNN